MKPVSWDKQLGLASPLETAASQSGKIKSPSNKEAGLDVSHHALVSREGRGENFFLDILFYRMSEMGMLRQTRYDILIPSPGPKHSAGPISRHPIGKKP